MTATWTPEDQWQKLVDGTACPICDAIESTADDDDNFFVCRLPMSVVRLSNRQRPRGYTFVTCRKHATELFELSPGDRAQFMDDVANVAQALQTIYQPIKLNYEILGNIVPHIHCHIIPRYRDDESPNWVPWPIFQKPKAALPPAEARETVARLRALLQPHASQEPQR